MILNERHDLLTEFPEHTELVRKLYQSNRDFARLLDRYAALDTEIYEIEQNGTNVTDEHAEALKFKRVALKDRLYAMLQEHAA